MYTRIIYVFYFKLSMLSEILHISYIYIYIAPIGTSYMYTYITYIQ